MSEKANFSNISTISWTEKCVTCPFNKTHRLLSSRLILHLNRCARNYSGVKMVRCPFNITHVLKVADLENHVISCVNRSGLERFQNPETLPESKPESFSLVPVVESSEDWDIEPDVPTYDPSVYCATNPVVRVLHGASPAARREFRELERMRFRSLPKEFNKEI